MAIIAVIICNVKVILVWIARTNFRMKVKKNHLREVPQLPKNPNNLFILSPMSKDMDTFMNSKCLHFLRFLPMILDSVHNCITVSFCINPPRPIGCLNTNNFKVLYL